MKELWLGCTCFILGVVLGAGTLLGISPQLETSVGIPQLICSAVVFICTFISSTLHPVSVRFVTKTFSYLASSFAPSTYLFIHTVQPYVHTHTHTATYFLPPDCVTYVYVQYIHTYTCLSTLPPTPTCPPPYLRSSPLNSIYLLPSFLEAPTQIKYINCQYSSLADVIEVDVIRRSLLTFSKQVQNQFRNTRPMRKADAEKVSRHAIVRMNDDTQ